MRRLSSLGRLPRCWGCFSVRWFLVVAVSSWFWSVRCVVSAKGLSLECSLSDEPVRTSFEAPLFEFGEPQYSLPTRLTPFVLISGTGCSEESWSRAAHSGKAVWVDNLGCAPETKIDHCAAVNCSGVISADEAAVPGLSLMRSHSGKLAHDQHMSVFFATVPCGQENDVREFALASCGGLLKWSGGADANCWSSVYHSKTFFAVGVLVALILIGLSGVAMVHFLSWRRIRTEIATKYVALVPLGALGCESLVLALYGLYWALDPLNSRQLLPFVLTEVLSALCLGLSLIVTALSAHFFYAVLAGLFAEKTHHTTTFLRSRRKVLLCVALVCALLVVEALLTGTYLVSRVSLWMVFGQGVFCAAQIYVAHKFQVLGFQVLSVLLKNLEGATLLRMCRPSSLETNVLHAMRTKGKNFYVSTRKRIHVVAVARWMVCVLTGSTMVVVATLLRLTPAAQYPEGHLFVELLLLVGTMLVAIAHVWTFVRTHPDIVEETDQRAQQRIEAQRRKARRKREQLHHAQHLNTQPPVAAAAAGALQHNHLIPKNRNQTQPQQQAQQSSPRTPQLAKIRLPQHTHTPSSQKGVAGSSPMNAGLNLPIQRPVRSGSPKVKPSMNIAIDLSQHVLVYDSPGVLAPSIPMIDVRCEPAAIQQRQATHLPHSPAPLTPAAAPHTPAIHGHRPTHPTQQRQPVFLTLPKAPPTPE